MLLLVGTSAIAQTCPPPGETEGRCIELTADGTHEASEVQISPEQPTTFRFDSDVRADGLMLENRERFEVAPGKRILTLIPSERVRGEQPSTLTVCFADGAAPACVTFRLVVHPAIGERRVELFRRPRPVESLQAELKKTREENARLHAESERLRAEQDRPNGLTGLFASGMVGKAGIPSQDIVERITERKAGLQSDWIWRTQRERSRGRREARSWSGRRARYWMPTFWPAEPIPPGKERLIWIEVMAPDAQTGGPSS
jgi:uncharacterized protein (TIGR02268 family)